MHLAQRGFNEGTAAYFLSQERATLQKRQNFSSTFLCFYLSPESAEIKENKSLSQYMKKKKKQNKPKPCVSRIFLMLLSGNEFRCSLNDWHIPEKAFLIGVV